MTAQALLDAGARITPEVTQKIEDLGKDFEFIRANYDEDSLPEADAALTKLYHMFGVTPVPKRQIHDGVSPIIVPGSEPPGTPPPPPSPSPSLWNRLVPQRWRQPAPVPTTPVPAMNWAEQHQALWEFLVPASGHAQTVQGEVIRISGRLSIEILGNAAANWDADYRKLVNALLKYLASGHPLPQNELDEAAATAKEVLTDDGTATQRLRQLAVQWVKANPQPIALGKTDYKR
jgi:hypothetical protein